LANWGLPEADAPEALLDVDGEEGSRGADCSALEANPHEVVPHGDVVDGSAHEAEAHVAVRDALEAVRDADGEEGVLGDFADCSAPEAEVHEAEADAHEAALDADGEGGVLGDLADFGPYVASSVRGGLGEPLCELALPPALVRAMST
jgi:hypothetical protein